MIEEKLQPSNHPGEFWKFLDRLVESHPMIIDRPRQSTHPRHPDITYPLDYGYLEGTTTIDEGGIDLWLGSLPEQSLQAVVFTVDLQKDDVEIKLLIGCTEPEEQVVLAFHNSGSMRGLLVHR